MECDLHVRLRAQKPPFGSGTPHCRSTSTGPFGLAPLALGSSFFFFFAPGFSASPSILRFLPFFAPGSSPLIADFLALISSSSSPFSFLSAASLASLASFFFFCFSAFLFRQSRMWVAEEARSMGRRQCLHCTVSTLSSRGRPVGKPASVFSSSGLTTGEPVVAGLLSASGDVQIYCFCITCTNAEYRYSLFTSLSFQFPAIDGLGAAFLILSVTFFSLVLTASLTALLFRRPDMVSREPRVWWLVCALCGGVAEVTHPSARRLWP